MANGWLAGPRPAEVQAARVAADGTCEVLVRWERMGAAGDTWEPVFSCGDAAPMGGAAEERVLEALPQLPMALRAAQPFGDEAWITRVAPESRGVPLPAYVHVSSSRWAAGTRAPLADFVVACECGRGDAPPAGPSCAVQKGKVRRAPPDASAAPWDEPALRAPTCARGCACGTQTADGLPAYDAHGRLRAEAGPVVSECSARCACGPACANRVVQRGRTHVLELVWLGAAGRGWGVRAASAIDGPGVFVERYVGEVIAGAEAARRAAAGRGAYIFDLDVASDADGRAAEYCLDARRYGNVSRFFNHSCEPNMRVVATLIECADARLHGIAFVTTRRISAGEELTFDYLGGRAPRRRPRDAVACLCGSPRCRGYVH